MVLDLQTVSIRAMRVAEIHITSVRLRNMRKTSAAMPISRMQVCPLYGLGPPASTTRVYLCLLFASSRQGLACANDGVCHSRALRLRQSGHVVVRKTTSCSAIGALFIVAGCRLDVPLGPTSSGGRLDIQVSAFVAGTIVSRVLAAG
ncbi:hypothetical protein KPB2_5336 [Klebsiella pneumoniae Kb677]|nr:hypothetical protein KPB2_5336 [Klebsiella pneumoniae Kb677]